MVSIVLIFSLAKKKKKERERRTESNYSIAWNVN